MALNKTDSEKIIFNSRFCGRKKVEDENPSRKHSDTDTSNSLTANKLPPKDFIFNIKKARYEVMRYGLTGFDKDQQTNAKIAMAIKLGAKPPKKKCVNYKLLMEQKKKEKEAVKTNRHHYSLQLLKQKKKSSKKKMKKQPNSLV